MRAAWTAKRRDKENLDDRKFIANSGDIQQSIIRMRLARSLIYAAGQESAIDDEQVSGNETGCIGSEKHGGSD